MSEGIGILLLVPILGVIQGETESENPVLGFLLEAIETIGISTSIGALLILFLILVGFRNLLNYIHNRRAAVLEYTTVDQLRSRCFSALLKTEWRWITTGKKSDHANLLLTDVSRVGHGLHYGLRLIATLFTTLVYLTVSFVLSWKLTLLALASGGLVFLLLSGQRRKAHELGESLSIANQDMQSTVSESLSGIKLAKILGNENRHLNFFEDVTERLRHQQLSFVNNVSLSYALISLGGAALLAVYLYVGLEVTETPVAELLTLVLVFSRLIPMFTSAQQQYHYWLHDLPAVTDTENLLLECKLSAEPDAPPAPGLWPINQEICLEDVTVQYADRERSALESVSLCFPARTTTAIMGASGSGKTTLADILTGLLVPDRGNMKIDGVMVSGPERIRWRHSVAYVPQEVFLFHDTIRNNLLWAKPDASDSTLRKALEMSAAEFVFKLPDGMDSVVGDAGIRLSGGERQRIALARALLRQPSLLILDEATSALDIENEARIRQAIENLHGELTVVIIGHRLPTLEHADQVVILEEGAIKAQGTWAKINAGI